MSSAATRLGASAPRVWYSPPGTGRQDSLGSVRQPEAKHLATVMRTLQWADESAERGDYCESLAWLDTVEAIGDELPEFHETRRDFWSAQLAHS